jgi:hypothetical protein
MMSVFFILVDGCVYSLDRLRGCVPVFGSGRAPSIPLEEKEPGAGGYAAPLKKSEKARMFDPCPLALFRLVRSGTFYREPMGMRFS